MHVLTCISMKALFAHVGNNQHHFLYKLITFFIWASLCGLVPTKPLYTAFSNILLIIYKLTVGDKPVA